MRLLRFRIGGKYQNEAIVEDAESGEQLDYLDFQIGTKGEGPITATVRCYVGDIDLIAQAEVILLGTRGQRVTKESIQSLIDGLEKIKAKIPEASA
jgi:hypothetical protein